MGRLVLLLTVLVMFASPVQAGKNAGGAIVVHTDDSISWTWEPPDFCEIFPYLGEDCGELNPTSSYVDPIGLVPAIIWYIAAFPAGSSPGVTEIRFGHDHNFPQHYIVWWSLCGPADSFEIPDDGWPDDPSAGNVVVFGSPVSGDRLFPFYWVGPLGDFGNYIGTGIHPTLGYAGFLSDDDPSVLDECTRFGQVRWFEPGYNECPEDPVPVSNTTWGRVKAEFR